MFPRLAGIRNCLKLDSVNRFPKLLIGFAVGCLLLVGAAVEAIIQLTGPPLAASRGVLSEHEIEELDLLPPQTQAERLLQRSVNQYEGAAEQIEQRVDGWRGQLEYTKQLETLTWSAYNSSDLRVRAASAEISLAAYGLEKAPATADHLIQLLEQHEQNRPFHLWALGLLGSRGVEVDLVFRTLQLYLNHPREETRKWAVNAIAMLGTNDTIPVLLDIFRYDQSLIVKERAACSLAETGMLTRQQRQQAVPDFLRLTDDHSLPPVARKWAFQALRDITGQPIGNNPTAWRNWAAVLR